jgi:hypothetical protein
LFSKIYTNNFYTFSPFVAEQFLPKGKNKGRKGKKSEKATFCAFRQKSCGATIFVL